MSILSPLDRDLALVYSPLLSVPFRRFLTARRDRSRRGAGRRVRGHGLSTSWPWDRGRCLMLDGLPETRRRLERAGCQVATYAGEEISRKGEGGAHLSDSPRCSAADPASGRQGARPRYRKPPPRSDRVPVMAGEKDVTLWFTPDGKEHFLVPTDAVVPEGPLLLRTMLGRRVSGRSRGDPIEPYRASRDEVSAHLKEQADRGLAKVKNVLSGALIDIGEAWRKAINDPASTDPIDAIDAGDAGDAIDVTDATDAGDAASAIDAPRCDRCDRCGRIRWRTRRLWGRTSAPAAMAIATAMTRARRTTTSATSSSCVRNPPQRRSRPNHRAKRSLPTPRSIFIPSRISGRLGRPAIDRESGPEDEREDPSRPDIPEADEGADFLARGLSAVLDLLGVATDALEWPSADADADAAAEALRARSESLRQSAERVSALAEKLAASPAPRSRSPGPAGRGDFVARFPPAFRQLVSVTLIIAEKPSVGRDIARIVGARGRRDGYLEGDRYWVSWCVGHLAELCEPHEYDPAWKRWSPDLLPILPERFKVKPSRSGAKQLRVLRRLLRAGEVTDVVNACDAGREGELIFRYVYELTGLPQAGAALVDLVAHRRGDSQWDGPAAAGRRTRRPGRRCPVPGRGRLASRHERHPGPHRTGSPQPAQRSGAHVRGPGADAHAGPDRPARASHRGFRQ